MPKKKRSQLEESINGSLEEWAKEQETKKKPVKKVPKAGETGYEGPGPKELSSRFRIF